MACPRRSFCQRKAWRCPGRFHSTPGTAAWASRFTGRPADANASPPTPPAPSHDQPTRHGKQHAASRSACRDNTQGPKRAPSRDRRPAVAEKLSASRRRVSQRPLWHPWDPLWPGAANKTKPLPLARSPLPAVLKLKRCSTVLHANSRDCLPSLIEGAETRDACSPSRADGHRYKCFCFETARSACWL